MARDLDAGAAWVIAEGRESGTVGLYHADQGIREDLVSAILAWIPQDKVIFEAPGKSQQAWFVRQLGADVNIGNVAPASVLSLETLRLGLRADTASATALVVTGGSTCSPTWHRTRSPGPTGACRCRKPTSRSPRPGSGSCCAAGRSTGGPRSSCCATARHTALVAVRPESPEPLFSPVAELRVLSGPETHGLDRRAGSGRGQRLLAGRGGPRQHAAAMACSPTWCRAGSST